MGLPRAGLKEQSERNAAANRAAGRDTLRDFFRTCLQMVAFVCVGYALVGLSAHTSDLLLGKVYYWAGLTIWIPGVLFTLLGYYRRGEKRGDW